MSAKSFHLDSCRRVVPAARYALAYRRCNHLRLGSVSPSQNRVGAAKLAATPPAITDAPAAASIAVYPRANAVDESYGNVVATEEAATRLLGAPGISTASLPLVRIRYRAGKGLLELGESFGGGGSFEWFAQRAAEGDRNT